MSASFDGEGTVRCVSPPRAHSGAAPVRLVIGDAVLVTTISFVYHDEMSVSSVEPVVGVLSGGTRLRIRGSGFDPSVQMVVRIGMHSVVRADVLSATLMECTSPSAELPGPLAIEASRNSQDFTGDEVLFEYQSAMRVDEVAPARGPVSGGALVVIAGAGFSRRSAALSYTHVRFNTTRVPAVWHSSSELRAVAPEHAAGLVLVSVTQNDQQYSGSLHFEYEDVAPHSLAPGTGPVRGGTMVLVRGSNVHGSPGGGEYGAFCEFAGSDVVSASFDGYNGLRCVSPPAARAGSYHVAIVHSAGFVTLLTFTYHDHPQIESISPVITTASRPTRLRITGTQMTTVSFCKFQCLGHDCPPLLTIATSSHAVVMCDSPLLDPPGLYQLEVSTSANQVCAYSALRSTCLARTLTCIHVRTQFTDDGFLFEALAPIELESLAPAFGPVLGGSLLQVLGQGFSHRAAALELTTCKFNTTVVPAQFKTEFEIWCTSPRSAIGPVAVEASNDGQSHSTSGLIFVFSFMKIASIYPMYGPQDGGTLVTVYGSGFVPPTASHSPPSSLVCEFGGAVDMEAEHRSSSTIVCATPRQTSSLAAITSLRMKQNGAYFGGAITFTYVENPLLLGSHHPISGPTDGGTVVHILIKQSFVSGYDDHREAACYFGDTRTRLSRISSVVEKQLAEYTCVSPLSPSAWTVEIGVSFNGVDVIPSSLRYEYHEPVQITSIVPSRGGSEGGTRVQITGTGFSQHASALGYLYCMFNSTKVVAAFESSTQMMCHAPAHTGGSVSLEVTTNNQQYSSSGLLFTYDAYTLVGIQPTSGPARGGTRVLVSMDAIPTTASIDCIFGDHVVPASVQSGTSLICESPPLFAPSTVHLSMAVSSVALRDSIPFFSYPELHLTGRSPIFGPVAGGTPLTIFGRNIPHTDLWCRFGGSAASVLTPAMFVSSEVLSCASPSSTTLGETNVHVSRNQQDFWLETVGFEYVPSVRVTSLIPLKGPIRGLTSVFLRGDNFFPRAEALGLIICRFEHHVAPILAPASQVSASEIVCVTSSEHNLGISVVEVSANGVDFSADGRTFEFVHVALSGVHPQQGPRDGGTMVTVRGTGFDVHSHQSSYLRNADLLACEWAGLELAARTPATSTFDGSVRCVTPSAPESVVKDEAVRLQVRVGGSSHGPMSFYYFQTPAIVRIYPVLGPSSGGTLITIDGSAFTSSTACRFDAQHIVAAQLIGDHRIQCVSPVLAQGGNMKAALEVSSNMFDDFDHTPTFFTYVHAARVLAIYPRSGPVSGGTFIRVTGENFSARGAELFYITCRFNTTAVPAVYVSSSELACYSPEMPAGAVVVEFSNNHQDFTTDGVVFTFLNLRLTGLEPSFGPISGGTEVQIEASHLAVTTELYCHFAHQDQLGEIVVQATMATVGLVTCITPRVPYSEPVSLYHELPVTVHMTLHEAHISGSISFVYVTPAQPLAITPPHGPARGGTLVTIYGRDFAQYTRQYCLFGPSATMPATRAIAVARFISPTALECISPPLQPALIAELSNASLDLALNVVDEAGATREVLTQYTYYAQPHVQYLRPNHGPLHGGTEVVFHGFFPRRGRGLSMAACAFNSTKVAATQISDQKLRCIAPSMPMGFSTAEVSMNLVDWSDDGILFEHTDLGVYMLTPTRGPVAGHTVVTLHYTQARLDPTSKIACTFGLEGAVASVTSSTTVACRSPPAASQMASTRYSAAVPVRLLADSALVNSDNVLTFRYEVEPLISAALPMYGPTSGGTSISLFGAFPALRNSEGALCVFTRQSDNSSMPAVAAMPVQWLSASKLRCSAPPFAVGFATIRLSTNGQNLSTATAMYEYQLPVAIDSIAPTVGPVSGSLVQIRLQGSSALSAEDELLVCRFGEDVVQASVIDHETVKCFTPMQRGPRTVPVECSTNSQQYSTTGLLYSYEDQFVQAISPSIGPTLGGTVIEISAAGTFTGASNSSCILSSLADSSSVIIAATVTDSANGLGILTRCVSPPQLKASSVTIAVSVSGSRFKGSLVFSYYIEGVIKSIYPISGPQEGGTSLTVVSSQRIVQPMAKYCRFAVPGADSAVLVPSLLISENVVKCTTPAVASVGLVDFELSDGASLSVGTPDLSFRFDEPSQLLALTPDQGSPRGGTLVVISAHGLVDTEEVLLDLRCRFNVTVVMATYASPALICAAPASQESGFVKVSISSNGGHDFSTSTLVFEYRWSYLLSLSPPLGPLLGGTHIEIQGRELASSSHATTCVFAGSIETAATIDIADQLRCLTPSMTNVGAVTVVLRAAGGIRTAIPIWFQYTQAPVVSMILPSTGPVLGGTQVNVFGNGFAQVDNFVGSFCSFSNATVIAEWVSETHLRCTIPRLSYLISASSAANVTIRVSTNGQQWSGPSSASLQLLPPVRHTLRLSPSRGPLNGGTSVTLYHVDAMVPGALYACQFGTETSGRVPASSSQAGATICISPPFQESGYISVSLYLGTIEYSSALFEYRNVQINDLLPIAGPTAGGTLLKLTGTDLAGVSGLHCSFGDHLVLPAHVMSGGLASCITPSSQSRRVTVAIHEALTAGHAMQRWFTYRDAAIVSSMAPSMGPVQGGTQVTLHGSSLFVQLCLFDTPTVKPVLAHRISEQQVICVTPNVSVSGAVSIRVVEYGYSASTPTNLTFVYQNDIHVAAIHPTSGPIRGGTLVRLVAQGIHAIACRDLSCQFGDMAVWAVCLHDSLIACTAPPGKQPGYASLQVSQNGEFWSESRWFLYSAYDGQTTASPSDGPISGGTRVVLRHSSGFAWSAGASLSCHFGAAVPSPASVLSGYQIICIAPPSNRPQSVAVGISSDGASVVESVPFTYTLPAIVSHVEPRSAPAGYRIRLLGSFVPSSAPWRCSFTYAEGQMFADTLARWESAGILSCVVPLLRFHEDEQEDRNGEQVDALASVRLNRISMFIGALSMSSNATSSNQVAFDYMRDAPHIFSIQPAWGPTSSSTLITLYGSGFFEDHSLYCNFGVAYSVASCADLEGTCNSMQCEAPPLREGVVQVSLRMHNGVLPDAGSEHSPSKPHQSVVWCWISPPPTPDLRSSPTPAWHPNRSDHAPVECTCVCQ